LDITQELRDTENALRDFIASVLASILGDQWIEQLGVSEDRLSRWRERKAVEEKRQQTGVVEERLLYYADFYDLKTILKKHWPHFSAALGDWKTMEVYLATLETLRDPDAHRRELLPHQKHLILGIGGEIRTCIVRYRSKQETAEDYFPRFESIRDSLGSIWVPGGSNYLKYVVTGHVLRPGDSVDFVCTATDPLGELVEYAIAVEQDLRTVWQREGSLRIQIEARHIMKTFVVHLLVRSLRNYHAHGASDDHVQFAYTVLPARSG